MNIIEKRIKSIRNEIKIIAKKYGCDTNRIRLVAVSKNKPIELIQYAILAGQKEFGENYVKEGVEKIYFFSKNYKLIWHFIGQLQSNKSRLVAEYFDWCHTIDCTKIIHRLNVQRPPNLSPLNVLIQVNIDGEKNKGGIASNQIFSLAKIIKSCINLQLRGIMCIPTIETNFNKQIINFVKIFKLFKELQYSYSSVDTLSLGMSHDMIAAIAAGSNLLRIGTAIFGSR
ncbi:YggS family pyridoxal phosphate-dependent enzyme [Candidatus Schneideria nysicola]|uniref:YggS family pyridoxal phosphate-dependent enzyme n=1 Tax=Candidatus Schneideria nysicola TaxID=1081631 RepID=UPI001CAA7489|nr:YggS family pyridoxal phosphate-dependent enzyme [Candidatus Schneideria nysicola]UAJ65372.1 YggS family pyridoxal phosphate-dependent enzyme [Candidatus Schneideria nysicola]